MRFTTSPGVSGFVADEQTHVGLGLAEVGLSNARYSWTNMPTTLEDERALARLSGAEWERYVRAHTVAPPLSNALAEIRPPIVLTRDDGHFSIPCQKHWVLYIIPMDFVQPQGTLVIKRNGYEPLLVRVGAWETIDIGDIFLKPVDK